MSTEQRVAGQLTGIVPGDGSAAVGRSLAALVAAPPDAPLVRDLWAVVRGGGDFDDALGLLGAGPFDRLPDLVVVGWEDGTCRVVVRGAVGAVVHDQDGTALADLVGGRVHTWAEHLVEAAGSVTMWLGAAVAVPADGGFAVELGLVPAAGLRTPAPTGVGTATSVPADAVSPLASAPAIPTPAAFGSPSDVPVEPAVTGSPEESADVDGTPAVALVVDEASSQRPATGASADGPLVDGASPTDVAPVGEAPVEDDAPVEDEATEAGPAADEPAPDEPAGGTPPPPRGDVTVVFDEHLAEELSDPAAAAVEADGPVPPGPDAAPAGPIESPWARPAAPPVSAGVPTPGPAPADDPYDRLFGATEYRSIEDAAVRAEESAPGPSPAVPPPMPDLDHDGMTVSAAELGLTPGSTPLPPSDPPRGQLAVRCPDEHLNPAHASGCRVCGMAIPTQAPFSIDHVDLGEFAFSTGQRVPVRGPLLIGRSPKVNGAVGDRMPELVSVPSPEQDISRTHVEVRVDGWQVLVVDRDSTNGTTVVLPGRDPQRLRPGEPFPLPVGARVVLAEEVEFTFEVPG
jgi:hypothetical protein